MIYVVAAQQDLHNKQLFKMLELMGHEWADRLEHVNFGALLLLASRLNVNSQLTRFDARSGIQAW